MKKYSKFIFAALLALGFASCQKKIVDDLQPIDQIPAEKAIKNMNDLTQAVNGVYGSLSPRRWHYISALMTDEVRLGVGAEYRNVGNILFNWQHVADSQDWRFGETGDVWSNLYVVIDRANRVLEVVANVPTTTPAENTLKTQFRGEMLAMRAFAHLYLLMHLSATPDYQPEQTGVILMTTFAKNPATFKPARNKQGEVMTQIVADLNEARNLIPTSWTNTSRITRNAATAIQAKAALYARDWATVVARATELINAQPITSRANYAALWTTRNLPDNQSTEVIWKYNVNPSNLGFAVGSLWQDLNGAVQASAAQKLVNQYDQTNDIRFPTFFRNVSGRWLINKYGAVAASNGENFQYDIKILRTSDLLLARAEAYAEQDQLAPANADLAALRTARITGYTHTAINDKATLIAEILNERYKELAYEGHRYIDLKRKRLPIQRDLSDVIGNTSIQTLPVTDQRYVLPISSREIQANPNAGQNPGY